MDARIQVQFSSKLVEQLRADLSVDVVHVDFRFFVVEY